MSGADLRNANLTFATLIFANLNGANLAGANLEASDMHNVNLSAHIPQFGTHFFGYERLLFLPVLLDCGNGEKEVSEEEWNEKRLFLQV